MMATALIFQGGNQKATFSPVTLAGDFTLTIVATNTQNGSFFVSGGNSAGGLEVYRSGSGKVSIFIGGSILFSGNVTLSSTFTSPDTIVLSRSSGVISLTVNGTPDGSGSNSDSLTISTYANRAGVTSTGFAAVMYLYSCTVSGLHNWDAASSDTSNTGAQPILVDTIGANNATGESMPTDGSAWAVVSVAGLAIQTPDYSFFRDGSGNNVISGTYAGTPASIEYSIDGGAWQVGDAAPSGETFSFAVSIPQGESTVTLRFSDDIATTDSVILVNPALIIASGAVQSNFSGRLDSAQTYTSVGGVKAYMLGNDDVYKELVDPTDSVTNQVDDVSRENVTVGGSWIVRFANEWIANQGTPIAIVQNAKGGTTIGEWQKDSIDRVGGLNLYESMARRIALVGGVDVIFAQIGETDSNINTDATVYKYEFIQFAADVKVDFGTDTFITPLHTITATGFDGNGTTTGQAAIRQAQIDAASESVNISIGSSITDLDVSGNDGLHFNTDAQAQTIAERMYASYTGAVSSITLNIGAPDGTYHLYLAQGTQGNVTKVYDGPATFAGGGTTVSGLPVAPSTLLRGFVDSSDTAALDTGDGVKGVTV